MAGEFPGARSGPGSVAASRICRLSLAAGSDAERARSQVASVALARASFSLGVSERPLRWSGGGVSHDIVLAPGSTLIREMTPTVSSARMEAAAAISHRLRTALCRFRADGCDSVSD